MPGRRPHTAGRLVTVPGGPTFSITKQEDAHCLVHAILHLYWVLLPQRSMSFEEVLGFLRNAEMHFSLKEKKFSGVMPALQGTNFKIEYGNSVMEMMIGGSGYKCERYGMKHMYMVEHLIVSNQFFAVVLKGGHFVSVVNKHDNYYVLNSCSPYVSSITIPKLRDLVDNNHFIVVEHS